MTLDIVMSVITYLTGVLCGGATVHVWHLSERSAIERKRLAHRKALANLMRQKPKP